VSNRSEYPECKAIVIWEKDGLVFSIVKHSTLGHYCGYVRFPKRPVKEKEYGGILTYVPVHGGITYAKESEDGSIVYGFDCAHCDDWSLINPDGKKWTIEEVKREAGASPMDLVELFEVEMTTAEGAFSCLLDLSDLLNNAIKNEFFSAHSSLNPSNPSNAAFNCSRSN